MEVTKGKLLSVVVAVAYVIYLIAAGASLGATGVISLPLLLPLSLIWFPDEFGDFTGYVGRGGNIRTKSPGYLISAAGWFFLIGWPVLVRHLAG